MLCSFPVMPWVCCSVLVLYFFLVCFQVLVLIDKSLHHCTVFALTTCESGVLLPLLDFLMAYFVLLLRHLTHSRIYQSEISYNFDFQVKYANEKITMNRKSLNNIFYFKPFFCLPSTCIIV
jgi:hypothetical protein